MADLFAIQIDDGFIVCFPPDQLGHVVTVRVNTQTARLENVVVYSRAADCPLLALRHLSSSYHLSPAEVLLVLSYAQQAAASLDWLRLGPSETHSNREDINAKGGAPGAIL